MSKRVPTCPTVLPRIRSGGSGKDGAPEQFRTLSVLSSRLGSDDWKASENFSKSSFVPSVEKVLRACGAENDPGADWNESGESSFARVRSRRKFVSSRVCWGENPMAGRRAVFVVVVTRRRCAKISTTTFFLQNGASEDSCKSVS